MPSVWAAVWPCIVGNLVLRIGSASAGTAIAVYLRFMRNTTEGVDPTFLGLLAVAFYGSELVTAPFFGSLSDRYGRKRFMLLGTMFGGVAVLLLPWIPALPLFLAARALEGLSSGSSVPAVLGYLAGGNFTQAQRGRVMAVFEVATIVGFAAGYAVGGIAWDKLHVNAFFAIFGIYALTFVIFLFVKGDIDDVPGVPEDGAGAHVAATHSINLATYRLLLKDRGVAGFLPAWVAVNAVLGLWGTHLSFQLVGARIGRQLLSGGLTATQAGLVSAGIGVTLIVGTGLWMLAFGKWRNTTIMGVATLAIAYITIVLLALNHTPAGNYALIGALVCLVIGGMLVAAGFTPAALAYLADLSNRFPAHRGSLMGLYSVLLGGGQLIGGWLGGFFAEVWAVDGLVLLTALFGLVAMGGLFVVARANAEPATPDEPTPAAPPPPTPVAPLG